MRLEVRDLKLVTAIADCGTLTRAGQQLHLTQSALSHQLADLEARLGGPLYERAGRSMILTKLGRRLAARARETLRQLRDVEEDIARVAAGREATLRLATECYTCYHWLPPVLARFGERHPAVHVEIVPQATARPVRALLAGAIDLCILSSATRDRRVAVQPLFDDELVLVVGPQHRLANSRVVEPIELRDERFLLYSSPDQSVAFQDVLAPAGVSPHRVSRIQLTEAILELVKAGLGVTLLARWAVEPSVASGAVRAISVAGARTRREWTVATRAARPRPEYLDDFVAFLSDSVARPPRAAPDFAVLRSVCKFGAPHQAARR